MQEVLLEALTDIDMLCRRHGLRYSLYCGTLLGAVREGAFIPWDDDADLMMPIGDARAFFRYAREELKDKYVVQDLANTPSHPWLWMRVFRKNTTYLRKDWTGLKVHHGIAVDIYPMIGVWPGKTGYRIQRTLLDLSKALRHIDYWNAAGYPEDRTQRRLGRILACIPAFIRRPLSILILKMAALSPEKADKLCTLDGAPFVPKYDRKDWESFRDIHFCGKNFLIPEAYDRLLTIMYGDYRTPPPEGKRKGHGEEYGGVIIDTERDYRTYLSETQDRVTKEMP